MPRFAAIDVGSNASRLRIVEALAPDDLREIHSARVPVRLGHEVFLTGKLDPKTIDHAVRVMRGFAEAIEDAEVERYRAVVTASARESDNGDLLLARVKSETGIVLEGIDGSEEARLVRLAVGRVTDLSHKRALLTDLGGGSLEITEVDRGKTVFSTSLEIGTVRLLESFLAGNQRVKPEQEHLLLEYLDRMLAPLAPQLARRRYDLVAGTGGNFEAIASLVARNGVIPVAKARALLARLAKLTPKQRERQYDLRRDRADVIVPALYVLVALADATRARQVLSPGVGLKDGILVELVDKHFRVWDFRDEEDAATTSATQVGRRYHFDEPHATQVDRLASRLFDALAPVHKLEEGDRRVLRIAALLHDVGDFVSFASHHKHTQYVIEHSEITGLSLRDRLVVGCVARYHRRAMPSPKHASYRKLIAKDRLRVRKMAAILRIADAFDREHLGKVKDISVRLGDGAVTLIVRGHGDFALELWTAARKASLFEEVFRRKLVATVGRELRARTPARRPARRRAA